VKSLLVDKDHLIIGSSDGQLSTWKITRNELQEIIEITPSVIALS
jgi:hypothetical protein